MYDWLSAIRLLVSLATKPNSSSLWCFGICSIIADTKLYATIKPLVKTMVLIMSVSDLMSLGIQKYKSFKVIAGYFISFTI